MKRVPLIILLTALVTGAFLFISTCNSNSQKAKPDKIQLIKAQEKMESIDKNYNAAFDSLKASSDSLKKELSQTQSKLKIAKMKLTQSQISLVALAKKDTVSLTIAEQLEDCDSLKAQTLAYVDLVDSARCIYESNISQLQILVATKDTQIVVCRNSYSQLKNLVDENLERERKLTKDLQTAYKAQRRKTFQNKLLAGGMLILSGISTTLYINANK